jgi:hypothetical protein
MSEAGVLVACILPSISLGRIRLIKLETVLLVAAKAHFAIGHSFAPISSAMFLFSPLALMRSAAFTLIASALGLVMSWRVKLAPLVRQCLPETSSTFFKHELSSC